MIRYFIAKTYAILVQAKVPSPDEVTTEESDPVTFTTR
jgi:hypothetical protein